MTITLFSNFLGKFLIFLNNKKFFAEVKKIYLHDLILDLVLINKSLN